MLYPSGCEKAIQIYSHLATPFSDIKTLLNILCSKTNGLFIKGRFMMANRVFCVSLGSNQWGTEAWQQRKNFFSRFCLGANILTRPFKLSDMIRGNIN